MAKVFRALTGDILQNVAILFFTVRRNATIVCARPITFEPFITLLKQSRQSRSA